MGVRPVGVYGHGLIWPNAKRVLIVEDEPDLRASLRRFLELSARDFRVEEAASASEALAVLESKRVDAVVTDLRMPGRDGLDLLEEVARRWPSVRRILITAYPSTPEFAWAVNEGELAGFLLKPFDSESFVGLLRRVFGDRPGPAFGRIPPIP